VYNYLLNSIKMGIKNLTETWGNAESPLRDLDIRDLVRELLSADRDPVDYERPIELESHSLVSMVREQTTEHDFELPKVPYEIIERVLDDIAAHGVEKGVRIAQRYAHEYLSNRQLVTQLVIFAMSGGNVKDGAGLPRDEQQNEVYRKFTRTIVHLDAARLHLFNRKTQREADPDLEELYRGIDFKLLPIVRNNKRSSHEYWA